MMDMKFLQDGTLATCSFDKTVKIWDLTTYKIKQTLAIHTGQVRCLAVLANGDLVSSGFDNTIRISRRGSDGKWAGIKVIPFTDVTDTLQPLLDGTFLSAGNTAKIWIWDPVTGNQIRSTQGHTNVISRSTISGDGSGVFITGSYDRNIKVWSPNGGYVFKTIDDHKDGVLSLTIIDDRRFASSSNDAIIKIFDSYTGELLRTFLGHSDGVPDVALLTYGPIASGSYDKTIKIWDINTGQLLKSWTAHTYAVRCLLVLKNRYLASGGDDMKIQIWDTQSAIYSTPKQTLTGHAGVVMKMTQLSDSSLISGSWDGTVRIWRFSAGLFTFKMSLQHGSPVNCVAQLEGGTVLAAAEDANRITLWDIAKYKKLKVLEGHTDWVFALLPLPGGGLMSGSYDSKMIIWDVETGNSTRTLTGHTGAIRDLMIQPFNTIVSASKDGTIKWWIRDCEDGGGFCFPDNSIPILCSFAGVYCPPQYGASANVTKPVECPPGSFCPPFSLVPTPCTIGTFSSTQGRKLACEQCDRGNYCIAGSTKKSPCPDSSFCPSPSQIFPCSSGFHCPAGSYEQKVCEAGSFCDGTGLKRPCDEGYFCTAGTPEEKKCSKGFHCPNGTEAQTMCSAGVYCDGSGVKKPCSSGYYCTAGTPREIQCTAGQYCGPSSTLPSLCPPGFYCPTPAEIIPCSNGTYCQQGSVSAEVCEPGYYCQDTTSKIQCEIGSYCSPGSTSQKPCPPSFYCPKPYLQYPYSKRGAYCAEGSKEEFLCEAGFFCSNPSTKEICAKGSTCKRGSTEGLPCAVGTYNDKVGVVDETSCLKCPEYTTTVTEGSTDITACVCSTGYYIRDGSTCINCVEGLICNSTGLASVNVTVTDGFFPVRSGSAVSALRCPIPLACKGSACTVGHKGFLCDACDAGYFKFFGITSSACSVCDKNGTKLGGELFLIILAIGALSSIIMFVKIRGSKRALRTRSASLNSTMEQDDQNNAGIIQRMLLNHFQLIGILNSFNFEWPEAVKTLISSMNAVGSVGVGNVFGGGVKCLLYIPSVPDTVNELLVSVYLMAGGVTFIVVFWLLRWCLKSKNQIMHSEGATASLIELTTGQKVTICIVGFFYLIFSQVLRLYFRLFSCVTFEYDGKLRLSGALDIECWSSSHLRWIAASAPILLVVIIGLPSFAFLKMWRASTQGPLTLNTDILVSYGFLFEGYDPAYWYWEYLLLIRKVCLSAISVFLSSKSPSEFENYQQGFAALMVMIAFLVLQMKFTPYKSDNLNRLEEMGLIVGIISLYMGYYTFIKQSQVVVTIVIICTNCLWALWLLRIVFAQNAMINKCSKRLCGRGTTTTLRVGEVEMMTSVTTNALRS